MRILYIAKHGSGGNDDEGAIAYALEQLGHEIIKVQEFGDWIPVDSPFMTDEGRLDLCLFHKWANVDFIRKIKIPKVFWYFDLVDWPQDPMLRGRCDARKRWMAEVMPLVDLGFCTDGDWVDRVYGWGLKDKDKLNVLRQGADERVVGFGSEKNQGEYADVLYVGGVKGCGVQRESFVRELTERYGDGFAHVQNVYGRNLANLVAGSKVVVCPDSPVTDRYWSNRVYVMAGFGACLLHPMCAVTSPDRPSGAVYGVGSYSSRTNLFSCIDTLFKSDGDRQLMSNVILRDIQDRHLYRHRCEELVRVVKERLGI